MKKNIRNVVLVIPNGLWAGTRSFNMHPYSVCLLASVIEKRYNVSIVDANLENYTIQETIKVIFSFSPDVIGISTMSIEYAESSNTLINAIKSTSKEVIVINGGVHPTVMPDYCLKNKNIDFIVMSEGEERFIKLLNVIEGNGDLGKIDGIGYTKNNKTIINAHKHYITNLSNLPFPSYNLVNYEKYSYRHNKYSLYNNPRYLPYAVTISTRGCPFNCIFCSSKTIQGSKCRMRSSSNVLQEIDWLVEHYGIREIIFLDDNLLFNRKRFIEILDGLIERKYDLHWKATNVPIFALDSDLLELMKKSGCYQVTLPIESGNQLVVSNIIQKPLKLDHAVTIIKEAKRLEYEIACLFVIGLPGETWDQIMETVNFAGDIDVDWVVFSLATPLPNTHLYEISKSKGYLDPNFSFTNFNYFGFGKGTIQTDEFSPHELQMIRALEWDRINFKTEKKRQKIALMNSLTMEELKQWRFATKKNIGESIRLNTN